jgi:hypothetical protein
MLLAPACAGPDSPGPVRRQACHRPKASPPRPLPRRPPKAKAKDQQPHSPSDRSGGQRPDGCRGRPLAGRTGHCRARAMWARSPANWAPRQLKADPASPGRFDVEGKGFKFLHAPGGQPHRRHPSGRPQARRMWLQLANKSMLMSQKLGQRLADECMNPAQQAVPKPSRRTRPPSLLEPSPGSNNDVHGPRTELNRPLFRRNRREPHVESLP